MKKREKKNREGIKIINQFFFIVLGCLSGLFYFGGLWLTLCHMSKARYPIVLTILSYVIRTAIIFVILYFIALSGKWTSILFWLMGFIVTRIVLAGLLKENYLDKKKFSSEKVRRKDGEE